MDGYHHKPESDWRGLHGFDSLMPVMDGLDGLCSVIKTPAVFLFVHLCGRHRNATEACGKVNKTFT